MGPTSDQLERQIGELRGQMDSRVVELRELGRRRVRMARRVALVTAGVGAAVGLAAIGVFVVRRLTRPPTRRERLQRLIPVGTLKDVRRARETLELRGRRRLPSMRLYVGDRRVGEEPEDGGRWARIAVAAARAAGTAAAGAVVSRVVKELRPGSPKPGA
jgi:hypothetical protein